MSFVYTFEGYELNETIYNINTTYIPDLENIACVTGALSPTAAVTLCVVLIAIFLLAIPGNLLVGWVIGTSRQTLTPSDVYLFNLTIADGLMALTLPFWAAATIEGWVFGDFLCKFLSLIREANFYTSILFLACISIDRYLVIVRASESLRSRQKMCSRILCAAVWALGGALALPALFNQVSELPDSEGMMCQENFHLGDASLWRNFTRRFRHIFGFFLPLGAMIACYSVTIARLLRTRGFQKHRAMKVIIAVVIAFLLCWTPYHVVLIVETLLRAEVIHYDCALRKSVDRALAITQNLALSHSCINPVLYAFVGVKFRDKMTRLLPWKARQERMSGSKFSRSTSQTSENIGAVL
ncbi:C-X-C chemokine receptor type 2-like [Etheostoma cragini]|uniref:C-X-C chemokine receptor type 2-like n=1 Tax=Etheostoma cragini TaxID=417921 RepID=UPI00155EB3C2|nr:C-X-C chemokine receptor type 2-like [Etheostoma cragini]